MSSDPYLLASGDFSQDWSDSGQITANDDWSGVVAIVGYRGDDVTSATGADPRTLTADPLGPVDVNHDQANPVSGATITRPATATSASIEAGGGAGRRSSRPP